MFWFQKDLQLLLSCNIERLVTCKLHVKWGCEPTEGLRDDKFFFHSFFKFVLFWIQKINISASLLHVDTQ